MNRQNYCVGDKVLINDNHPYYRGKTGIVKMVHNRCNNCSYIIEIENNVMASMKADWIEPVNTKDGEQGCEELI